jgi:PAS domain S-box-containing protein
MIMTLNTLKQKNYRFGLPPETIHKIYSKADILHFVITPRGIIRSVNAMASEKLSWESADLSGKNFLSLFPSSEQASIKSRLEKGVVRGYFRHLKACMLTRDHDTLYVQINGLTEMNENGDATLVHLFIHDQTELARIRLQRDLATRFTHLFSSEPCTQNLKNVLSMFRDAFGASWGGFIQEKDPEPLWHTLRNNPGKNPRSVPGFIHWSLQDWEGVLCILGNFSTKPESEQISYYTGNMQDLLESNGKSLSADQKESLSSVGSLLAIPMRLNRNQKGYAILVNESAESWGKGEVDYIQSLFAEKSGSSAALEGGTSENGKRSYENLINMNMPLVGILLVRDSVIRDANAWAAEFLGVNREDMKGKKLLDYIVEDYHETISGLQESGISPAQGSDIQVRCGNGKVCWVECSFFTLNNNRGGDILCIIVSREDKQALHKQLIYARRMESLGMLAGGIVHDFNNLLASILGYSSLLSEDVEKESPYYEDIQQIFKTAEKATELTSRLLAFTQAGSMVVSSVSINQLIKEVAGILSRTLNKNITIRAELDQELHTVKGDPSQIQLTLLQVALNARDAMLKGGKMLFKSKNIFLGENSAWQRLGGKTGEYVQITISDTGTGMSGQIKEKIFNPNFTTKVEKGEKGMGLGLSIVQEIVENHGGFISVFSEKDKGTVFKLHFPVSHIPQKEDASPPKGKPALGKETILLVENEKVLMETARKMLTRYGYKVMSAQSGLEAANIYKKHMDRIDLVIMDALLPGVRIDKVINWLKKCNPKVKIIASSNSGFRDNRENEYKDMLEGYVQKPFRVRPLLKKIRTVLNA